MFKCCTLNLYKVLTSRTIQQRVMRQNNKTKWSGVKETPDWGLQPGHRRVIVGKLMTTWQTSCHIHRYKRTHAHILKSKCLCSASLPLGLDPCFLSSLRPTLSSAALVSVLLSVCPLRLNSLMRSSVRVYMYANMKPQRATCSLPHTPFISITGRAVAP